MAEKPNAHRQMRPETDPKTKEKKDGPTAKAQNGSGVSCLEVTGLDFVPMLIQAFQVD